MASLKDIFRKPFRNKGEVGRIHQFPILLKTSELKNILVYGSSWKGGQFGKIKIVQWKAKYIIHAVTDAFFGFTRQPKHKETLNANALLFDEFDSGTDIFQRI